MFHYLFKEYRGNNYCGFYFYCLLWLLFQNMLKGFVIYHEVDLQFLWLVSLLLEFTSNFLSFYSFFFIFFCEFFFLFVFFSLCFFFLVMFFQYLTTSGVGYHVLGDVFSVWDWFIFRVEVLSRKMC